MEKNYTRIQKLLFENKIDKVKSDIRRFAIIYGKQEEEVVESFLDKLLEGVDEKYVIDIMERDELHFINMVLRNELMKFNTKKNEEKGIKNNDGNKKPQQHTN